MKVTSKSILLEPSTTRVGLPVLVPDTLISMNVPDKLMYAAIAKFNKALEEEELILENDGVPKAQIIKIDFKTPDDLLLILAVADDCYLDTLSWEARMIGYLVIEKKTGEYEEIVIDGFKLMRKSS